MERIRRLLLLAGTAAAALAFFHADFSPLLRLAPPTPERADRRPPLAAEGPEWDAFLAAAREGFAGTGRLASRREEGFPGSSSPRALWFRPDERPLASVADALPEDGRDVSLRTASGAEAARLRRWVADEGDLTLGAGLAGVEPPAAFFRPLRPLAPWLALAGVLVFALLPRRRRPPDELGFSGARILTGDVLGAALFALFFTLPLAITGAVAAATTTSLPLTLVFWFLAGFGVLVVAAGARAAGFAIRLEPDAIAIRRDGPFERHPFAELAGYAPATLRPPRWFRGLLVLGAIFGRGGAAGAAAVGAASAAHGFAIRRRDGETVFLWLGRTGGGSAVPGAERIPAALRAAGVPEDPPVERTGFLPAPRARVAARNRAENQRSSA